MVKAKGKLLDFLKPDSIDIDVLETFDYQPKEIGVKTNIPAQKVTYTTKEFWQLSFSGLPDIATVTIEYIPGKTVLELKSLKYYFLSYRNVGIYQEHATQRIFQDINKVLKPKKLAVTTLYNTRGGIDTTCVISTF